MLGDFDFTVCVLACHADADVTDLAARLGRTPTHLSRKGEPTMLAGGRRLPNSRHDSRCLVELASDRDGTLAECVVRVVELLESQREFIEHVNRIGGSVEVFVRWYPNGDTGETLSPNVLARLGSLGVNLGFNVYGVEPGDRAPSE